MTDKPNYDMGLVGLGTMGHNLALNIAEHGFSVAGYDQDMTKIKALAEAPSQGRAARRPSS